MKRRILALCLKRETVFNLRFLSKRQNYSIAAYIDALVAEKLEQTEDGILEKLKRARQVAEEFSCSNAARSIEQLKEHTIVDEIDMNYLCKKGE